MSAVSADNVLVQPECAAAGSALGAPAPAASEVCCQSQHGYLTDKSRYLARAKRIEGQARGIGRMIDEDQYCIDILTQISALTSALENVALALLEDHLRHCVVHAAQAQGPGAQADLDAKIAEAAKAVQRLVKS